MVSPCHVRLIEIDLPEEAGPILDYAENMFARQSFKDSMTELEEEMRA